MSNQSVTSESPTEKAAIVTPLGEMLTRHNAARYLKDRYGFGSVGSLAKAAMAGNGPRFHKFSATRSLYPIADLDAWALAKLGEARATFKTEAA